MKDRIRQIMESQHMTQQVFAQFIEVSPATLSSIFNGRTNPTMNIVGAIKKKIPNINTDWLMFGTEPMYLSADGVPSAQSTPATGAVETVPRGATNTSEPILDFGPLSSPAPTRPSATPNYNSVRSTHPEMAHEEMKIIDKPPRRVIEIRVFYDDQTWDTFVPAKK